MGHDGTNYEHAAVIKAYVDGDPTDGADMPGRLEFLTTPDGSDDVATRMTIKNDGKIGIGTEIPEHTLSVTGTLGVSETSAFHSNVGIGQASPSHKLQVETPDSGIAAGYFHNSHATNGYGVNIMGGDDANVYALSVGDKDGNVAFRVYGNKEAYFSSNVGIGTTSPQSLLHLENTNTKTWPTDGSASDEELSDFLLTLRNNTDTQHAFAGIAFDVTSETDADSIGAAIFATSDNTTAANHDANLVFATNDAGDDGLTERMRITHDGRVGIGDPSNITAGGTYPLTNLHILDDSAAVIRIESCDSNAVNEPTIVFSRGKGTVASPSSIADDDNIGNLSFAAHDGTDYLNHVAQILVQIDGTPGSDDTPGRMTFSTTADGANMPTERMRIDSSGNVTPGVDNTQDLGASGLRWANIYTGDLHLKNERGDWTIVEEENYLCVVNNKTGKKYEMMLKEIED